MNNNKTIMNTRNFFTWLLGLMLIVTVSPIFTACSSDDDDNNNSGGNGKEQTDSLTAMYDDLEFLQRSLCLIDSAGKLVRYEIGEAIQENDPQHRYIGVDNIEEAAKIFARWIAPDVKLDSITSNVTNLTAQLTDTLGHAQGTIYFRAGNGTTVAEVTASAETKLKYVSRVTFLLNSAWPYNSETVVWHKGDIRKFRITGNAAWYLWEIDKELDFVLIREGRNGEKPMWVTVTKEKYPRSDGWGDYGKVINSDYCPGSPKAHTISDIMKAEWDFFKGRFSEADAGELRDDGSYLIDASHYTMLIFENLHLIMLSNGWEQSSFMDPYEQILLKIDWLDDGQYPLRATAGTNITSGFEDVRGSCDNLFDGMNETMWETNHLTWASQSAPKYYVEFESSELIKPTGYTFVTGSVDQWPKENCNPHNWKLYGKKKARNEWTLLDERSGENLPFGSYQEVSYNLTNGGGEYQYFRLEITDNQPWLKLAEFKFKY